jgi:hypothetical protein
MNKTTALGLILTVSTFGALWGCEMTYLDIGGDTTTGSGGATTSSTGSATTSSMSSTAATSGGTGGAKGSSTATTSGSGGAQPVCVPNMTQPCYTGPAGTEGHGICHGGTQKCAGDGMSWGPCTGEVLPQVENCATAIDEDCNGMAPACTGGLLGAGRFGDSQSQFGRAIATDNAGNVILAGDGGAIDFGGGNLKGPGVFVTKLDANSTHVWSKSFADSAVVTVSAVAIDVFANVAITGSFADAIDFGGGALQSASSQDVFVAKLDANGEHLWSRRLGGPADQIASSVASDALGHVLVAGYFAGSMDAGGNALTSAGIQDAFVGKLDASSGTPLWLKRVGASGSLARAYGVAVDGTGNVLVVGTFTGSVDFGGGVLTSNGSGDVFVVKFDANGAHQWSKRFGDASDQQAMSIAVDSAGNALVTGAFAGSADFGCGALTSAGGKDIFLAKLDPVGACTWAKHFGDASDQQATSVAVDAAGNVVLTGGIAGQVDFGGGPLAGFGAQDIFVAKFQSDGALLWAKRFGDDQDHQIGNGVAADSALNVVVTGEFLGTVDFGSGPLTSAGGWDLFFAKFAP